MNSSSNVQKNVCRIVQCDLFKTEEKTKQGDGAESVDYRSCGKLGPAMFGSNLSA